MRLFRVYLFVTTLVTGHLFAASESNGELVFGFGQGGVAGESTFFANPGSELEIDIFVLESNGTVLQDLGIGSARFELGLTESGVMHAKNQDFRPATGFSPTGNSGNPTDLFRMVDISGDIEGFNVVPIRASSGESSVLLGTAKFRIDPDFVGSVTLNTRQVSPLDVSLGSNLFTSGSVGLGSATVTAVPEPGSLIALSTLAVGGIVFHRRRRMARSAD